MRLKLLLFLLSGILPVLLFAQKPQSKSYDRAVSGLISNTVSTVRFSIPENTPGRNISVFETPFAAANFIKSASSLNGKIIEKIQLIYTTFAVSPSFDQKGLNGKRLTNLFASAPELFESPLTQWELVGQTGAKSPEEGRNYFHGFVITWRPESSPELMKKEMHFLDSLFFGKRSGGGSSSTSKDLTYDTIHSSDGKHVSKIITMADGSKVVLDRDIPEDSLWRFMRPSGNGWSVIKAKYGDSAHTVVIVTEMSERGYQQKRVWKMEDHKGELTVPGGSFTEVNINIPDSVVLTVLRRNGWNNMTVVCDVTGSMSPYTAQMFNWLPPALYSNKCAGFVFFNDGDSKKNNDKTIGKTGGVYFTKAMNYDSICKAARQTMAKGDGGDARENDLEAVLFAIENLNPSGDIVLIADNWGPPRDLELYSKLNRPVHIVLCGALGGVNPDYLFLARKTGGTIHTLKDDITNLATMQEGETVKIGYQTFLLNNDHFIPLENFRKW